MARKPQATGWPQVMARSGLEQNAASPDFELGALVQDTEGNTYRYIQAAEALTAGDVVATVAKGAWDSGVLVDGATAVGDTKVHVDTITTAVAADFYRGYYISQATAAGLGRGHRIKSHDALSASGEADIHLVDTMGEIMANNAALLIWAPWRVEQIDATTEIIAGVAVVDITDEYYGFIQVGGHVPVVKAGHSTSEAITINESLVPVGSGNAGAVQGRDGILEADLLEVANSQLIALQTVAANTTGFVEAVFRGIVHG